MELRLFAGDCASERMFWDDGGGSFCDLCAGTRLFGVHAFMHARLCVQTDNGNHCNGFIPRLIDSSDPPLTIESNDSMLSDCSSFLSSAPPGWMYSMDMAVKLGSSKLCRPSKVTRSMCLAPDCVCMHVGRVWHACMLLCVACMSVRHNLSHLLVSVQKSSLRGTTLDELTLENLLTRKKETALPPEHPLPKFAAIRRAC